MPDAATLDEVNHHIGEIFKAGNANQRKAIVETFVVKIKMTGPGRIVPVFRVSQAAEASEAANAERGGDRYIGPRLLWAFVRVVLWWT